MIERDFYRLSVLAEMWRCSTADILHLGIQNRAMVCVNLYGERSKMTFRHAYPHTGVTRSSLDAVANVHAASHFNNSDADDGSDVGAPIDDVQAATGFALVNAVAGETAMPTAEQLEIINQLYPHNIRSGVIKDNPPARAALAA